jgi:acyl-CoA reductase-like NAD-dependent aldehyde dehydrogenase
VRSVYAEVQEAFAQTNVPSLGQLAERVEAAQDELQEAAGELEEVTPPPEAEAANAQIAEGFRLYAEELDRLRNAAERGDQRTIDDFNAQIADRQSVRQIMEAAEAMKFKGYDLGPIAEE